SYGLQQFQKANITEETSNRLSIGIKSLASAFAINPIDLALIIPSSIAIGAAGLALSSVTSAIREWTTVDFTEEDGKRLMAAIGSISAAFAQAGGSEGTKGSVLSFLTGIDLSPNNVERGIDSVMNA